MSQNGADPTVEGVGNTIREDVWRQLVAETEGMARYALAAESRSRPSSWAAPATQSGL
jgi:hypothetical protein